MNLPKTKKSRRKLIIFILIILIAIQIILYFCLRYKNQDTSIAVGLLAGLIVALFDTFLRWIEEGK